MNTKNYELSKDELLILLQMRNAQKKYFRTRSTTDLTEAKALEKEVDKLLDDLQRQEPFQQQQLF